MLKKYFSKIQKIRNNCIPSYIDYCKLPIDNNLVLVEGGQGTNINGNMFAMLKEICTNPRWAEYTVAFVVTKSTIEKAEARMKVYGFSRIILTIRNSDAYCKYLATAKYIMTDNSFPPYFNKRQEQVFLNTWHGTPLKTLGKSNKSSLSSLANVQKNYLMSDYALFPNEFTKDVFMNDYDLRNIFKGKSLIANYPRNYIFYDSDAGIQMKKTLGYEGKKVFAYMPTWRDASTAKEKHLQLEKTKEILQTFDEMVDDSVVLLVNLHFLLASEINCDEYNHVEYFPGDYDTYEILNACDGLVTDYSSVFFDYAVTKKKIILFAYDKEEYLSTRGLYMPFESLPFPIVEDVESLVNELDKPAEVSEEFLEKFCPNGWKNSCEIIFDMMVNGETDAFELKTQPQTGEKICLVYAGAVPGVHLAGLKKFIEDNPGYKYVVAYRRNLSQSKKDAIEEMQDDISVYGLLNAFQFKAKELFLYIIFRLFGIFKPDSALNNFFEREAGRMFYSINPDLVVDFSCANSVMAGILSKLKGEKRFVTHGDFYFVKKRAYDNIAFTHKFEEDSGFEKVSMKDFENQDFLNNKEDEYAHASIRKNSKMKNILPLYFDIGKKMVCLSLFSFKSAFNTRLSDTVITVGGKEYKPKYLARTNKNSRKHRGIYILTIPLEDVINLPATNMVALEYKDRFGLTVQCHIIYLAPMGRFFGLRGPMCVDKETKTVAVFRQSLRNRLNIYVRSVNVTDSFRERIKQVFAWVVSHFWCSKKAKKLVLLYEKNSSKYEESASVLFEELIEKGYDNAYFIVTRDYEFFDRIPEKYRNHIVYKFSFRHYLYFFKSRTFIGTEAIAHSIDLKTFNLLPLKKIASKNLNYVFLQHGVMYMVSLDSESRSMFKRKKLRGKYRVVVSSQAEKEHFTTLGRHIDEDIYVTGLPKFDRNTYSDKADKIVIMPTWRPWEINETRADFTQTPYFRMIMRIYDSVPENLKDKVVILPHPLILNELSKISDTVADKMVLDARYDDVLKDAAVLITDYSSIAYDAFYRGARVIFYWEEKDYCMEQYGPTTKLMLNEENVYGDYLYSSEGLSEVIERNYNNPQTEEQKEKYAYLVNFHDGKNTERLITFLKEDGII